MQKPSRQARAYPERRHKSRPLPGVFKVQRPEGKRFERHGAGAGQGKITKDEKAKSQGIQPGDPGLRPLPASIEKAPRPVGGGIPASGNGNPVPTPDPIPGDPAATWILDLKIEDDRVAEYIQDLKLQIRALKDLVTWFFNEREARRSPLMFSYPWGVRVATATKKNKRWDVKRDDGEPTGEK